MYLKASEQSERWEEVLSAPLREHTDAKYHFPSDFGVHMTQNYFLKSLLKLFPRTSGDGAPACTSIGKRCLLVPIHEAVSLHCLLLSCVQPLRSMCGQSSGWNFSFRLYLLVCLQNQPEVYSGLWRCCTYLTISMLNKALLARAKKQSWRRNLLWLLWLLLMFPCLKRVGGV